MSDRLARLDDYVRGVLADAEATAFEEELFEAVGDAEAEADLRFFDRANRILGTLAADGWFDGPATEEKVRALEASGVRLHRIDIPAEGGEVPIEPLPADAQLVVLRSLVDLRGYAEVEVAVENADGSPVKTFRGVECDPSTGNVYALCVAPLAQLALCTAPRKWRVTGSRDGKRELITAFESQPRR